MFEFSHFWLSDYAHGRDFVADLDTFLGKLPKGWPYGVEMRNSRWLREEYFGCLVRHGVTHVYNSWEAMPSISEQALLAAGRTWRRAAVSLKPPPIGGPGKLSTYDKVKEQNPMRERRADR
jgi:hypothetical protein